MMFCYRVEFVDFALNFCGTLFVIHTEQSPSGCVNQGVFLERGSKLGAGVSFWARPVLLQNCLLPHLQPRPRDRNSSDTKSPRIYSVTFVTKKKDHINLAKIISTLLTLSASDCGHIFTQREILGNNINDKTFLNPIIY